MIVGDRIRIFEITDKEDAVPEIQGMHFGELQTKGWYGTSCPEIAHYINGVAHAVIVGEHARHVATMVITKIKDHAKP